MTSGRIKSKVVQSTLNNKDVLDMFHGVLGTGENTALNLKIVYPKYCKIYRNCDRFLRVLEVLRDSRVMAKCFDFERARLGAYVAGLRKQIKAVFSAPVLAKLHPPTKMDLMNGRPANYQAVTKAEYVKFAEAYEKIKSCNLVNVIVVTCQNLIPHKKQLGDQKSLSASFLVRSGGLTFAPLPDLPAMNFKQLYIDTRLGPDDRSFFLMVLHKLYTVSHDVYESVSAPDVDVNEFVQAIMSSIKDVKKHIPRCDEAFDKILASVHLLKGNFNGYYKDYVASNNPTIIMENFVLDVSKTTNSSARVAGQFRRIISHYRRLASQQATHPKLKTLFQQVDKNFQALETTSRHVDAKGQSGEQPRTSTSDETGDNTSYTTSSTRRDKALGRLRALRALKSVKTETVENHRLTTYKFEFNPNKREDGLAEEFAMEKKSSGEKPVAKEETD
jgi:hypothetical protein